MTSIIWLAHFVLYWLCSGIYALFDYFLSYDQLLKYKTQHQTNIIKKRKTLQWSIVPGAIVRVIRNQLLAIPFVGFLIYIHTKLEMSFYFKLEWFMFAEAVLYLTILDLIFYCVHRMCHYNKWLYKNVHLQHHEWVISMGLGAFDMSAIDFMLTGILPMSASLLANTEIVSLLIGTIFATFVLTASHSGYYIHTMNTNVHDIHHIYCRYNYSSIWDRVFGTYRSS